MKKIKIVQLISWIILVINLIVLGIHHFVISLDDWIVRTNGVIMILGILVVSYTTVKITKEK